MRNHVISDKFDLMPSDFDHGIVRRVRGFLAFRDDSATAKWTHHATRRHAASLASIRASAAWPRHCITLPHSRSPILGTLFVDTFDSLCGYAERRIAHSIPPMRQILSSDGAYHSRALDSLSCSGLLAGLVLMLVTN
ncbi:hypothetical protein EXIGLDRAFT_408109 [Exidia glandulosa HHB12029]|uniref:Uncharacterized protein n=1 Tax=Exidia glandulosa HHB12029 TaxID=1314781 RepID=A0A165KQY7_EXIGL|nr:hypothetical protein EXIGLDRAFT_408109 [Exidia glandulosa HHB12029]